MIIICFTASNGIINEFRLSGHADFADSGQDIVCASVSSAAYMTANTITDIMNINADISLSEDDGFLNVKLTSDDALKAQQLLQGFKFHLCELEKQYPNNIIVKITEV